MTFPHVQELVIKANLMFVLISYNELCFNSSILVVSVCGKVSVF